MVIWHLLSPKMQGMKNYYIISIYCNIYIYNTVQHGLENICLLS